MSRKKILAIMMTAIIAFSSLATDPPRNVLSVRTSYLASRTRSFGVNSSVQQGFSAGVYDQIRFTRHLPFYIETGLELASKGYQIKGFDNSSTRVNYLGIPLGITYRIPVGRYVTIQPYAGIYYAYGVWGRLRYKGDEYDVFEEKSLSHNDFGYNVKIAATYRQFYLGIGYECSLIDISKRDIIYPGQSNMLGYRNLKNVSFSLTLGYSFNLK